MDPNLVILTYAMMILLVCAKVITLKYSDGSAEKIFDKVSSEFNFQPTYVEIYEQSTRTACDRLIVVRPFEWVFWAIKGHCYVLNALREFDCPSKTFPTLIIDAVTAKITEPNIVCYPADYNIIKNEYSSYGPPIINHFNIEDVQSRGRFTIYDALNYLFKYYIEINLDVTSVHPANKIMIEVARKKNIDLSLEDVNKVKRMISENTNNAENQMQGPDFE